MRLRFKFKERDELKQRFESIDPEKVKQLNDAQEKAEEDRSLKWKSPLPGRGSLVAQGRAGACLRSWEKQQPAREMRPGCLL